MTVAQPRSRDPRPRGARPPTARSGDLLVTPHPTISLPQPPPPPATLPPFFLPVFPWLCFPVVILNTKIGIRRRHSVPGPGGLGTACRGSPAPAERCGRLPRAGRHLPDALQRSQRGRLRWDRVTAAVIFAPSPAVADALLRRPWLAPARRSVSRSDALLGPAGAPLQPYLPWTSRGLQLVILVAGPPSAPFRRRCARGRGGMAHRSSAAPPDKPA